MFFWRQWQHIYFFIVFVLDIHFYRAAQLIEILSKLPYGKCYIQTAKLQLLDKKTAS